LRLVPVGGYDRIVEDLLLRLGLSALDEGAGAVLLLLDLATHFCECDMWCRVGMDFAFWIVSWDFFFGKLREMEAGVD
jgi:hypothetical protein